MLTRSDPEAPALAYQPPARRRLHAEMTTAEREAWDEAMRLCLGLCPAGEGRERIAAAMEAGPGRAS